MTTQSFNIYQQLTSVRAYSLANLSGLYFNGRLNNGVNSTLTASSVGALVVDGVNLAVGDRVLVAGQTSTRENGIYEVENSGNLTTNWKLKRSTDFQSREQLKAGMYFSVSAGNTLAGAMIVLAEPLPTEVGAVNTNFIFIDVSSGGGGPYLTVAGNLDDVADREIAYANIGLGSGQTLQINDGDFVGGVYQLPIPSPNFVIATVNTPGFQIRLPQADSPPDSPSLAEGPTIQAVGNESVDIGNFLGGSIVSLDPLARIFFSLENNASPDGSWGANFQTVTVNNLSGIVTLTDTNIPITYVPTNYTPTNGVLEGTLEGIDNALSVSNQDMQTTYDNSATGNINLATDKHITYTATDAALALPFMTQAQFDAIPTPPNGLMAWANDSDRVRVNKGSPGSPDYDELAYLTDITGMQADAAYGEAYFQANATETVIAVQGTPVKVAGTYNSGDLLGFSQAAGTFTYTDTEARVLLLGASLTSTLSLSTADVSFILYKNGAPIAKSTMSPSLVGVTPSLESISISCLASAVTNDTFEIFVQNDSNTDNILVQDLNFKATSLGGTAGASGDDLEDAYASGDGTMIMSVGKPLEFQSNDNAIVSTFNQRQTQIPANSQVISNYSGWSKNDGGTDIEYARKAVVVENNVAANESASVNLYGQSNGSLSNYMTYTGSTDTANYKSSLTVETGNFGVNCMMATSIIPRTAYIDGVWTSVWSTLDTPGGNIVQPGTFPIGQTVEVDINGIIQSTGMAGLGQLRFIFGVAFSVDSIAIVYTSAKQNNAAVKYKITRTDVNEVIASVSGWYVSDSGNMRSLDVFIDPLSQFYDPAQGYPVLVEWVQAGVGGGTMAFIPKNLNIIKYT